MRKLLFAALALLVATPAWAGSSPPPSLPLSAAGPLATQAGANSAAAIAAGLGYTPPQIGTTTGTARDAAAAIAAETNAQNTASLALPMAGGTVTGQTGYNINLGSLSYVNSVAVTSRGLGSGTNGPRYAQTGLLVDSEKTNFLPTSATGEVDGVSVITRNGGPTSDTSGILVNSQGTGQGFVNVLEGTASVYNYTSNTITNQIDTQLAALNMPTSSYIGLVLNSTTGANSTGLQIQNNPAGSWANAIAFNVSGTGTVFKVDGIGNVTGASYTTAGAVTAGSVSTPAAAITGGTIAGAAISSGSIAGTTAFPNPIVLGTINGPSGVASVAMGAAGCYHIPGGGTNFPSVTAAAPISTGSTATLAVSSMVATCSASGSNILSGGTGYVVGDVLTVVGGTFTTATRVTVSAVSGGAITAYTALTAGIYTVLPAEPLSVTGGTGTGATLQNIGYNPNTISVVSGGSGYTAPPAISFANTAYATLYTTAASATATLGASGAVSIGPTGTALGTSGASGTPVTTSGALIDGSGIRVAMTGAAYTVPANTSLVRFTQTGTIASQTVTLPTALGDGQPIQFANYAGAITALTFSPAVTGWTNGNPLAANTVAKVRWDATAGVWYLEQPAAVVTSSFSTITVSGAATVGTLGGGSNTATIAAGAGAGTSPTVAVSGKALDGVITITTGTSPSASSIIGTVTFGGSAFSTTPRCTFSPAGADVGASGIYITGNTTTFALNTGATALTASSTYYWNYECAN